MGKVVVFTEPKTIGFESYEDQHLKSNEVRLQTLYSGISAGTELTGYRGSNPYLHKQWDPARKLFIPAEQPTLTYPVSGCGYEKVGEVIELGSEVQDVATGDVIFETWENALQVVLDFTKTGKEVTWYRGRSMICMLMASQSISHHQCR